MTDPKKIASLEKLYQAMDSAEIEYRLAHGELSPIARELAKSELLQRTSSNARMVDRDSVEGESKSLSGVVFQMTLAAIIILTIFAFLHYVLGFSKAFFAFMAIVVVIPCCGALFGKAFPVPGIVIGSTILCYAAYFYFSAPDMKGTSLERGLNHAFLIAYTIGFIMAGCSFIMGAFYKGTDEELQKNLNKYIEDIGKAGTKL